MKPEEKDILARVGLALLLVQTAEQVIQFCLAWTLPRDRVVTLETIEVQKDDLRKKTLGHFLSELRKRVDLEVADGAKRHGCKDTARSLYDYVIATYIGSGYAALRERASIGIADLRH